MPPVPGTVIGEGLKVLPRRPVPNDVAGVVAVAGTITNGVGPHRPVHEDPLVTDGEEVGALQHEDLGIGILEKDPVKTPFLHVIGGV